jgi:tRNA (cmo5U34)-methyltransferase
MEGVMKDNQDPFSNPALIASYATETPRKVPGLADLHRMVTVLLSERSSRAAHILVVGAGGGLELKAMAEAQPDWTFTGVDPSTAMLDLARQTVGSFENRIGLMQGVAADAPLGPFDGATCLLTLHFLDRQERLKTLREIHRRLKPGAYLVVAHYSCPDGDKVERWLARSVAFADRTGIDHAKATASAATMAERLPILPAAEDEALLRDAGFADVSLFYAAFSFRGWVASASPA